MIALLLAALLCADDIPLVAPKKGQEGALTEKELAQRTRKKPKLGLLVGPKLGATFGVAGPLGPAFFGAVELGYRFPIARRILSLSIEPSFSNPSTERATELGTLRGPTYFVSVPLLAGANVDLGPGTVRILAGPSIDWIGSSTRVNGFVFDDSAVALGLTVGAGYLFRLGPGGLGLELRYRVTAPRVAATSYVSHAVGLNAAYVFDL